MSIPKSSFVPSASTDQRALQLIKSLSPPLSLNTSWNPTHQCKLLTCTNGYCLRSTVKWTTRFGMSTKFDAGAPLAAVSLSPEGHSVVIGSREVLKVLRIDAEGNYKVAESLRASAKNLNTSAVDVQWHPLAAARNLIATAPTNGAVVLWDLDKPGGRMAAVMVCDFWGRWGGGKGGDARSRAAIPTLVLSRPTAAFPSFSALLLALIVFTVIDNVLTHRHRLPCAGGTPADGQSRCLVADVRLAAPLCVAGRLSQVVGCARRRQWARGAADVYPGQGLCRA